MSIKTRDGNRAIYDSDSEIDRKFKDIAKNSGMEGEGEDGQGGPIADQERNANTDAGNDSPTSRGEAALQNRSENAGGDSSGTSAPQKAKGGKFNLQNMIKARMSPKKAMAGGVSGLLVTALVTIILAGPGSFIQYLNSILTEKVGELQTNQNIRYRRTKVHTISDLFSKDGRRAGRLITKMEARGYRFQFDSNNKVVGIDLPDGKSLPGFDAAAKEMDSFMERSFHIGNKGTWRTKGMVSFKARFQIPETSITRAAPDGADPDTEINKRGYDNAGTRGDLNADVNLTNQDPDNPGDPANPPPPLDPTKQSAVNQITDGNTGALDEVVQQTSSGATLSPKNSAFVEEAGQALGGNAFDAAQKAAQTSLGGVLSSTLLTTDLLDKLCTIKAVLKGAVIAARTFRALAMMRTMASYVGAADSDRLQVSDSKMINALGKKILGLDNNSEPIGASPGMSLALLKKFDKEKNDIQKSNYSTEGKPTGIPKTFDDLTSTAWTNTALCAVAQNLAFSIGLEVVSLAAAFFTAGGTVVAKQAVIEGVEFGVRAAIKKAIQRTITKKLGRDVALSFSVELGFGAMMTLMKIYAEKTLLLSVTGQEKGGQLGSLLTGGAGVMHKQRNLRGGMIPATARQYAEAQQKFIAEKKEDLKSQSLFARIFDIENTDSLVYNNLAFAPLSPDQAGQRVQGGITAIASAPAKLFTSPLKSINTALGSGKAYAQEDGTVTSDPDLVAFGIYTTEGENAGIELATDHAGNIQPIMLDRILAIDPTENIEQLIKSGDIDATTLQPKSEWFIDHIKNCVDNVDSLSVIESTERGPNGKPIDPKKDCFAELPFTERYKAHLAYLNMEDVIDGALFPEEIPKTPESLNPAAQANSVNAKACNTDAAAGGAAGDPPPKNPATGFKLYHNVESTAYNTSPADFKSSPFVFQEKIYEREFYGTARYATTDWYKQQPPLANVQAEARKAAATGQANAVLVNFFPLSAPEPPKDEARSTENLIVYQYQENHVGYGDRRWDYAQTTEQKMQDVQKLVNITNQFKAEAQAEAGRLGKPEPFFCWNTMPYPDPKATLAGSGPDWQRWQADNDLLAPLFSRVDGLCPSFYVYGTDHVKTETKLKNLTTELRRVAAGKPIITTIYPYYHPYAPFGFADEVLDDAGWSIVIDTAIKYTDGVTLFLDPSLPWPTENNWWNITKQKLQACATCGWN